MMRLLFVWSSSVHIFWNIWKLVVEYFWNYKKSLSMIDSIVVQQPKVQICYISSYNVGIWIMKNKKKTRKSNAEKRLVVYSCVLYIYKKTAIEFNLLGTPIIHLNPKHFCNTFWKGWTSGGIYPDFILKDKIVFIKIKPK